MDRAEQLVALGVTVTMGADANAIHEQVHQHAGEPIEMVVYLDADDWRAIIAQLERGGYTITVAE